MANDDIEVLTWADFNRAVRDLASGIPSFNFINLYGIPRGGLIIAVVLSHLLDLPVITNRNEVGRKTLIVDDISDSGKTLQAFAGYTVATLHTVLGTTFVPDYFARVRTAKWVIYPWESSAYWS